MTLTSRQRTAVFVVYLLLVLFSAGLEVFIIVKMVSAGEVDKLNVVISALNGTGLAALLLVFTGLVKRQFVVNDMISEGQLRTYFEGRLRSLSSLASLAAEQDRRRLATELVRECCRFAESVLKGWVGEYYFELSVFEDAVHPVIVAYYDSGGETEPRSKAARESNPEYYRQQKYEVVELLERPGNTVIYLPDTRSAQLHYSFTSEDQKRRIGSSILYCFCNERPRAVVITCDKSQSLAPDRRLETLLRALGQAMRAEYMHRDLVAASV